MTKVILIQRLCPHYRVGLFKRLSKYVDLTLYYGKGKKTGAFQNAATIYGIKKKQLFTIGFGFNLKTKGYYISWFPSLFWHLIKDKPQVVITEGTTNLLNNFSILLFSKITGTPFIWWDPGANTKLPKSVARFAIEPLISLFIKQSGACIAYGAMAKRYFLSKGICEEKIFIAQNTADFGSPNEKTGQYLGKLEQERQRLSLYGKKVLLYAGAIEKRRKIDCFLEIFYDIKSRFQDVALVIIGDGPEKGNIEKMVACKNMKDVHVLGRIIEDVGIYFNLCNLLVLPGWSSLAINQAMFYGKPVVTVSYGGPEYELIKNGENGFVVGRNDIKSLTNAIESILFDEELEQRMSQANLRLSEKVSLNEMVEGIAKAVFYTAKNRGQI